jgi:hypothetical protein
MQKSNLERGIEMPVVGSAESIIQTTEGILGRLQRLNTAFDRRETDWILDLSVESKARLYWLVGQITSELGKIRNPIKPLLKVITEEYGNQKQREKSQIITYVIGTMKITCTYEPTFDETKWKRENPETYAQLCEEYERISERFEVTLK